MNKNLQETNQTTRKNFTCVNDRIILLHEDIATGDEGEIWRESISLGSSESVKVGTSQYGDGQCLGIVKGDFDAA